MPWRMQFYKYYQLSVQNPSKFLKMWQIADFCQDHDTRDPQIITLFLWSKNFQCSCIKYMDRSRISIDRRTDEQKDGRTWWFPFFAGGIKQSIQTFLLRSLKKIRVLQIQHFKCKISVGAGMIKDPSLINRRFLK